MCIPECDSRHRDWKYCLAHYVPAMKMLRRKPEFTNVEILDFQRQADLFFQRWVLLTLAAGQTNYFHLLGSGHFAEYLIHWRTLYPHSQQGWEALNAMIKNFYFRRTNHGGRIGEKKLGWEKDSGGGNQTVVHASFNMGIGYSF